MSVESKVAFLPGGGINTAMALIARGNGYSPQIWFHSKVSYEHFQKTNQSPRLKGVDLTGIEGTHDIARALAGAELVSFAPRSEDFREVVRASNRYIGNSTILMTATKGGDEYEGRYYMPSQVLEQEIPGSRDRIAVVSGPNFAEQIAKRKITGTTVAAYNPKTAERVKEIFHNGLFWVEISKDACPIDVEVIGAYKNVVGLIMGFARTMPEYDENTGAFILQKGLYEASLLCEAMGGNPKAIMELCGVGDYGLLMNSTTSRNVRAGEAFGRERETLEDLIDSDITIEGIRTVRAIRQLARRYEVSMPLALRVYRVLYTGMKPAYAVRRLLLGNAK